MKLSSARVKAFQKKILSWYAENKRDLPWRNTRDPYKILVSEVMLQQTQVSRVLPKYDAWLKQFPTVASLANATVKDVLQLWSGLGYNRRALNLQKTARMLCELRSKSQELRIRKDHAYWPTTIEALKMLPGIGEYTARAVACFAFDTQVVVVDTNVRKVILLEILHKQKEAGEIEEIAAQLLPKGKAYEWNQALMDYAALVLKERKVFLRKQPSFNGSNRYYRGKLLRLLLAKSPRRTTEIGRLLKDDFSETESQWLSEMLFQMEREGFVRRDAMKISLVSET